jgi:hypothetical protein
MGLAAWDSLRGTRCVGLAAWDSLRGMRCMQFQCGVAVHASDRIAGVITKRLLRRYASCVA